jgi:hypothetical protein
MHVGLGTQDDGRGRLPRPDEREARRVGVGIHVPTRARVHHGRMVPDDLGRVCPVATRVKEMPPVGARSVPVAHRVVDLMRGDLDDTRVTGRRIVNEEPGIVRIVTEPDRPLIAADRAHARRAGAGAVGPSGQPIAPMNARMPIKGIRMAGAKRLVPLRTVIDVGL